MTGPVAPRMLLCVAPLVPAGGVDVLLTAFGMLAGDRPGLTVQVVGAGPLSRVLHGHAAYLGIAERVDFRGRPTASAVRAAVPRCTALVLPHRADTGALPAAEFALRAAVAGGRPVVATAHAPCPDLLDADTVVPPGNPTALAQVLASVLVRPPCAGGADRREPRTGEHPPHRSWLRIRG